MSANSVEGWIVTGCDAHDMTPVHMAIGEPDNWRPAFRDFSGGVRVAKIRDRRGSPDPAGVRVYLRVGTTVTDAGLLY